MAPLSHNNARRRDLLANVLLLGGKGRQADKVVVAIAFLPWERAFRRAMEGGSDGALNTLIGEISPREDMLVKHRRILNDITLVLQRSCLCPVRIVKV